MTDYYTEGRRIAKEIFENNKWLAPADLTELVYGVQEYFDEYLCPKPDPETTKIKNRCMLLQVADGFVRTYAENSVGSPEALLYWWREGVPSDPMGWEWLTKDEYFTNCGDAYNYIRENYLPQMPELDWVALM